MVKNAFKHTICHQTFKKSKRDTFCLSNLVVVGGGGCSPYPWSFHSKSNIPYILSYVWLSTSLFQSRYLIYNDYFKRASDFGWPFQVHCCLKTGSLSDYASGIIKRQNLHQGWLWKRCNKGKSVRKPRALAGIRNPQMQGRDASQYIIPRRSPTYHNFLNTPSTFFKC